MEKKKISALKRRRRLIFLLTILGLVFISCWFIFRKKDYTIEYELDNYHITEAFNKEKDYYSFIIKKGEKEYHTILPNSNFISKKLIYKIEELEEGHFIKDQVSRKKQLVPAIISGINQNK